ncbi:MAG: DNA topoisomerase 3 [Candidatus Amulumruptor caecigallinarius]|nr:DNA topoisomerase 3 [Candidatus Amulumruptor caecigallinarius]MCM1397581.1 DNA topoisomerase 3 [Candidatus Amulumruptor caecigallinarius]MCM1453953.1 DNA topoisomerase 3 [bacterium]
MKVCITEKPSVARDIAAILGATERRDGYFEGSGWAVTWTFGHLCCLKEPHDYTPAWKRWALGALPMVPPSFGIKLIDQDSYKRQFGVIASLVKGADEVVNCGDAGQEGELIQRWVMQKAEVTCPVKRLWISSLTDESIRQGFSDLRPQAEFDNLYYAGLSRAIGDWLLGMNATRLYSLKYAGNSSGVLSVGRVQTPTLALIVSRHDEIVNFKPEDYWELKTVYRDVTFSAASGRFKSEADGAEALARVSADELTVTDIQDKKGREAPPRLFDLTSLQVECNKKWGWTADETLRLIQSLYEKKVTTYPRVDTTYLSEDIYPKVPEILRRMTPYAPLTARVLAGKIPKSKKVFDNAKVTDHHAIIPTGELPTSLVGNEKLMYHLIARRFIAAFYPDCLFNTTAVKAAAGGVEFKASGKVITSPGWREVYAGDKSAEPEGEAESAMPPMTVGEHGPHSPALAKKTTQPPKEYTEGTLLRAMEGAGRTVDDEELREAMKENGIGRPSTRASIIETLFKRRYIMRRGKSILPTQAGIDLIATIREPLLKSAKLTGIWENKLRRIERGDYAPAEFIAELKQMVSDTVLTVLADNTPRTIVTGQDTKGTARGSKSVETSGNTNSATAPEPAAAKPKAPRKPRITKLEQVPCPVCGKGHILKGRTAYGCSRYAEGCPLRLPFESYPADLTPARLATRLRKESGK